MGFFEKIITFIYPFLSLFSFIFTSIFLIANAILIRKIYNKNCSRSLVASYILLIPLFIIYPQEYNFIIIIFSALSLSFYYLEEVKKFIYGVQIQSTKSTWFAIIFTIICAFILSLICQEFAPNYFLNFEDENNKNNLENHLSGLGDIMIGIGSALMALSIFVYESIARKRRYFDKYYLTGLTNNIVLTILYFVGLLTLLLIYIFPENSFINRFLEQCLFCYVLLLIILTIARFFKTAKGLLFREEGRKIEKEVVESYANYIFKKSINKVEKKWGDTEEKEYYEFLEDFFSNILKKLRDKENLMVKDDWLVVQEFYKKLLELRLRNKIVYFDHIRFARFLGEYLHEISQDFYVITYRELLYHPRQIFIIIFENESLITKDECNQIQSYFYYYQAMYSKGFELNKNLDELSKNEKNIANILLDRSRRTPMELVKYHLEENYKNKKITPEFFENYAIEFLIYYRNLAQDCFDNNDFNNFQQTLKVFNGLFFNNYYKTDDEIIHKIKKYQEASLLGLGAWILSETTLENLAENLKFINEITKNLNKILSIQLTTPKNIIEYFESEGDKFIKLYCHIKTDQKYMNLTGLDQYKGNKISANDIMGWMSGDDEINNFLVYFLLNNFNFSQNIGEEIAKIIGNKRGGEFFGDIKKILSDFKLKLNHDNLEIILHNLIKRNEQVKFDYIFLKLLKINKIENVKDRIATIEEKLNKIIDFLNGKKDQAIAIANVDKEFVEKYKKEGKEKYKNSDLIKKLFSPLIKEKAKNSEINLFGFNVLIDKEPFVKNSNVHTDNPFGRAMANSENKKIIKKIIDKIKPENSKKDLNYFNDILNEFKENTVIILLTNPHYFTNEMQKRTFYKDNFKHLNDKTKEANPSQYLKDQIAFYEFLVNEKRFEIPVYNFDSDISDAVLVLDKSRLGTIIQYDMSSYYKNKNSSELLEENNQAQSDFDNEDVNFKKEFYLDIIEFKDDSEELENILKNPPEFLKEKGDNYAQKEYLKRNLNFKFLQSFELEFHKNFEGYLFEVLPPYD